MTEYQQCNKCIMDNQNDPDLSFNEFGVCNHCVSYEKEFSKSLKGIEREKKLRATIDEIKNSGKNQKYDCLLGLSGGVDSSYLAYLCKKFELKPLIIHFDNGWNSELAVNNIEVILNKVGFELHTYVVNWDEFKDIQLSYFKAGVVDLEVPTDHAISAIVYKLASKYKIKFILNGNNLATEGVSMPPSWVFSKHDYVNLKSIHKKFGKLKLKTYPSMGFMKRRHFIRKFKNIPLLNFLDYNKEEAKKILIEKIGWRDYGGKHYESIFTRFYQGYILIEKFNIDKRQFHYSSLIQSGQITREQAENNMKLPAYNQEQFAEDKEYVLKKLNFSKESFKQYMNSPIHKHNEYKTEQYYWERYFKFIKVIKSVFNK